MGVADRASRSSSYPADGSRRAVAILRGVSGNLSSSRWPWLLAAVLVVVVYLASLLRPADPRPSGTLADIERLAERRDLNVLFVLIDTLRADRLGAWGYHRDTSPMLDWLGAGGVRFGRHLSQSSWTKCSMASLWTGLYPHRSRILRFDQVLPEAATLPAEILQEAGFRTVGLYRNGWVAPNFGFDQGFEIYHQPLRLPLDPSVRRENPSLAGQSADDSAIEAARAFFHSSAGERWFLYVHLMDVHQYTYDEESALFGTSYSDVYDNSIRREDRMVEMLIGHLTDAGMLQKTLIVISADHGEAFGERGFEGHARNVYQEVTEVPFILAFPFRLASGLVIDTRTENVDVWPTLLDLLGLPALEEADGQSLVPLIRAAAEGRPLPSDESNAYAELDQNWGRNGKEPAPTVAVAFGDFRYVLTTRDGREELFDGRSDAVETKNVIGEHAEVAERLRTAAGAYLASPPPPWGDAAGTVELNEMELNQLRALGYAIP